jgi:hypothetical protein
MPNNEYDWTDAAVATLRKYLDDGLPYAEIGRRMGTSKHSISNKVQRMGWCQPVKPRTGRYVGLRAKHREEAAARELRLHELEKKIIRLVVPPPRISRITIEPCTYVLEMGRAAKYCDAPSEPGKSMCAKHRAICYRADLPPEDRLKMA